MASVRPTPSRTVISRSAVISSRTGRSLRGTKRTSRWVRMPTRRPLGPSTTGRPEMSCRCIRSSAVDSGVSGRTLSGLTTMPASNFLTCWTWLACSSIPRFLCRMPIPPCCAMAIAIGASVTVSMAAETRGMPSSISRVRRVRTSTWAGSTSE